MAGVLETIFSRFVTRLRALFPPEVIGTVVALVGITVVPVTMKQFLGIRNAGDSVAIRDIAVAATTLLIMMGISVWSRGKLRLYSVLIGMAAGYLLSWMLGLLGSDEMQHVQDASWFGIPLPGGYGWALTWASVVPFAVAALCSSLKSMGDLVTCQKINDADWKRPDMQSVSRGILADAVGAMSAGVLGGMGQSTSTHNVALTLATGATSRRIAWATGAILLLLACFPKVAFFLVIMPSPVVGATLAFCIAFMILAGIQIISSRMLDTRKMLVVGIAIIVGLSVDVIPNGYRDVHPYLQPLFTSSLAIGTVTAIALNLIFRIGVSRRKRLVLRPDDKDVGEAVYRFMDAQGRAWGARPEIIARATRVLTEFAELNADQGLAKGDVTADVSFDEFNLNLRVQYEGRPLEFPESAPTAEEIVADETSLARLSAALIRRSVDRLRCEEKNGQCILHFHYEH
jgi:NCS2 family nucleobase:cation symporter-2